MGKAVSDIHLNNHSVCSQYQVFPHGLAMLDLTLVAFSAFSTPLIFSYSVLMDKQPTTAKNTASGNIVGLGQEIASRGPQVRSTSIIYK